MLNMYIPVYHTNRRSINNNIGVVVNHLVGMELLGYVKCLPCFFMLMSMSILKNAHGVCYYIMFAPIVQIVTYIRGDVKIPIYLSQRHQKGLVTRLMTFADVSQN